MTSINENFVGPERTLMVAATLTKRLQNERRLYASELRALDRETQTTSVLQRKDALAKLIPEIDEELTELQTRLRKMLASSTDQLNPSGKYYVMAEKLVKV